MVPCFRTLRKLAIGAVGLLLQRAARMHPGKRVKPAILLAILFVFCHMSGMSVKALAFSYILGLW